MCYCFLLFWDLGRCGGPPLALAPPILLLTCCALSRHASFCPTSLLLCHRPLFVLSLCFFPLRTLSDSRCLCYLLPSSCLHVFLLCVSVCQLIAWPSFSPGQYLVHTLFLSTSSVSPSWGLCTGWSWWAPPALASWGRARKIHQRTEGRSRRGQEPMPPGTGTPNTTKVQKNVVVKLILNYNVDLFVCVLCCSIHNAVIAVFQKKGLADNELYVLNEGVR